MALGHEIQTQYETPEIIAAALNDARREVVAMTGMPEFHESCAQQHPKIDPYEDMDKPAYWDTFANYAYEKTLSDAQTRGINLETTALPLDLEARQLLAETPRFLFAQMQLDRRSSLTSDELNYALPIASYYNNLLRGFAYNHPETNADDVKKGLLSMVNISVEDQAIRQNAGRAAYAVIHGAQHELAFGQILRNTGKEYYEATSEQDLAGMDYVVSTENNRWLGVDVKASDFKIANGGQFFVVSGQDKIRILSLTHDNEFKGKFFTSEAVAQKKAPYLTDILDKAAKLAA